MRKHPAFFYVLYPFSLDAHIQSGTIFQNMTRAV